MLNLRRTYLPLLMVLALGAPLPSLAAAPAKKTLVAPKVQTQGKATKLGRNGKKLGSKSTNAMASATGGLWLATTDSNQGYLSINFTGDFVTFTGYSQTLYGTFRSGRVKHGTPGADISGYVTMSMSARNGKAPKLHPLGKVGLNVRLLIHNNGLSGSLCMTAPSDLKTLVKTPLKSATRDKATPKNVTCATLKYIAGPALAPSKNLPASKAAPAKKKIKMRTRGLDWSLGR